MITYQLSETKNLILKLYDNNVGKFIRARVFDSTMTLAQTLSLSHISIGLYSSPIILEVGKFTVYYEVFNDAGFTSKDLVYMDTEELFNITPDTDIKLDEIHKLQGLDASSPLTVTETGRVAGSITQNFTGDGISTTTVTRV